MGIAMGELILSLAGVIALLLAWVIISSRRVQRRFNYDRWSKARVK